MNGKKAKKLRKIAKYDTRQERTYEGEPAIFDFSNFKKVKIRQGKPFVCTDKAYKVYKITKKHFSTLHLLNSALAKVVYNNG